VRTQVGIVGGGPAGAPLSHLLHLLVSGREKRKWKVDSSTYCNGTAAGLVRTGTQWDGRRYRGRVFGFGKPRTDT
jgi:hypothetical protein